jgi:hypothetical protein
MFLKIAVGLALALCIFVGALLWFVSRPKSTKVWNEKALIVHDAPAIAFSGEKSPTISLFYKIENVTDLDYSIETIQHLKIMALLGDGSLAGPVGDKAVLRTPIFLPAHHLGTIELRLVAFRPPERVQGEPAEAYLERLRQSMNEQMSNIHGFILFDDLNRYQINLGRWQTTIPEKSRESNSEQRP